MKSALVLYPRVKYYLVKREGEGECFGNCGLIVLSFGRIFMALPYTHVFANFSSKRIECFFFYADVASCVLTYVYRDLNDHIHIAFFDVDGQISPYIFNGISVLFVSESW